MHLNRAPVDNFGNVVWFRDYITTQPVSFSSPPELLEAVRVARDKESSDLMAAWECATSTYGGNSVSDCNEV